MTVTKRTQCTFTLWCWNCQKHGNIIGENYDDAIEKEKWGHNEEGDPLCPSCFYNYEYWMDHYMNQESEHGSHSV